LPTEPARKAIATLRRLRFSGPETAETLSMPLPTFSGILARDTSPSCSSCEVQ